MDLSNFFESNDTVWFHLEHPETFDPLFADAERKKPMRVALLSPHDPVVEDVEKKIANDIFMKVRRSRNHKDAIKQEDNERYARMRFSVRVADWENLNVDGKKFDCTQETKDLVYTDGRRFGWLRSQIEGFMMDDSAFLGGQKPN